MDQNETDLPVAAEDRPAKRIKTTATATSTPPPSREVGLMRSVPGDKVSSFVGSSSGVHFIRSVYSAIRAAPIATPGSDIVPGEDDHLPSPSPNVPRRLWRDHEISTYGSSAMTFDALVDWSRGYFSYWHPAYPFLHAPAVLTLFEKLAQPHTTSDPPISEFDLVIIRSIMSISLADRRQYFDKGIQVYPGELVFQSYDDAIHSVQHAFSQPITMQSLQAALSVQLFLVSMLRFNAASRLGGLIIRMALQMGLHRCPQRYPAFSPEQRELCHRVFFSLYCIDRFVCQSTGLPLSLRDDDIDVCYPSREHHAGGKSFTDTRLRLLEFLSRHCHIRGEIMEFKHKCIKHTKQETDQATVIASKLSELANDIDEFIDFDEADPPTLSPYHESLLRILHHEAIISLNRPIMASNKGGSSYDAALQQCIGSARFIISSLHKAIQHPTIQRQSPFSLLWPSFTWAVWISSFILFHAATTQHVSAVMVARFSNRSLEILEHLARRGSVWPEACGAAIRDLQTQLTLQASDEPADANPARNDESPGRSLTRGSRPAGVSLGTSPHIVAGAPNEGSLPTRRVLGQNISAVDTAGGKDVVSGENAGNQPAPDRRRSAEPHALNRAPKVTVADSEAQPYPLEIGNPSLSDPSQSSFGPDQLFQFSNNDDQDPFSGFDIPFWLGQDQYSGMVNEWS